MRLEPRVLLGMADEMGGLAGEREPETGLAILSAHAALESFVNETGTQEIATFNLRARFLPKWHDLCERVLGRQLDSGPDLERLHAIRDALVGYEGEPERLDRRDSSPPPAIPEHLGVETALWAVDAARRVIEEFHRLAGRPVPDWIGSGGTSS
jgi:hypothetical protein